MNDEASDPPDTARLTPARGSVAEGEARPLDEADSSTPLPEASEGSIAPLPTVALGDLATSAAPVDEQEVAAREASKDNTQVGLGVGHRATLVSQPSGTLLGIAAVSELDILAQEVLAKERMATEALAHTPGPSAGAAESLPRFDDNPLIAAFPPQRRRSPSAFDGFVPLGSPTRAFGDAGPPILPEPALDRSRASVEVGRTARQGRAPGRIIGVAAGCFGLAVSLAVASHALTGARAVKTEVVALEPSPTPARAAEPAASEAIPRTAASADPAAPATSPPEARDGDVADRRALHDPSLRSRVSAGADAGAPTEDIAERGDPRPAPGAPEPSASPTLAAAEPAERASLDAANPSLDARQLDAHQPDPRQLDPHGLDELFALETRSEAYRCPPAPAAGASAGERAPSPQKLWRESRRAQQNGDLDAAVLALCELTRQSPSDVRALSELATLGLRWGDAPGAVDAARAALRLQPEDAGLKQLLADALALLGELDESRRLWLEPFGTDAASEAQLIGFYEQRGKASLERSDFAKARTFFRRAVVVSRGGLRSSAGLGDALAGLGETRAAVVWARRAALATPRDAKLQLAYGDALYRAGDMTAARRAWSSAAELNPTPAVRRRLAKGHL